MKVPKIYIYIFSPHQIATSYNNNDSDSSVIPKYRPQRKKLVRKVTVGLIVLYVLASRCTE